MYIFDQGTNTISTTHLEYLKGGLVSSALDEHIYWSGTDCGVEIQNVNTQINNIQNKFKPLLVSRWPNMLIKDKKICFFRPEEQEFDIFNTVDKTWSIGTMPKPLPVWASVIVLNNEIYVAGGIIHGKSSSLVYKVDF